MNARHDPGRWQGDPVLSPESPACLASLARHVKSHPAPVDWDEFAERLQTCTDAQIRVLWLVSCGLLNKQIAHQCGISEATVKSHVAAALKKLRIRSRTAAAARFAVFLDRNRARFAPDAPVAA